MRDKKKIVIGVLCALVGIMAVGYAALATRLNITGTASIDSTWKVEITNITEGNIVGDATSKETPSYTATTANFSVGLIQPGDSITYDIEISNLGTLKAKVDSINVVMDENGAITYTTEGLAEGDTLGVNEKDTLSVTVGYDSSVTSQPEDINKDITVTINYVQDLGTSSDATITYETYSIGDTVTFAGSNWYVIKDSTADEDYVTLIKEKVLTSSELGDYGIEHTCTEFDVEISRYGCTIENEVVAFDTMSYYWSDTCHQNIYGYTDYDDSGCEGHNDYEGSKVREFLEGTYINTLGADNLKEVEGYKIRLITTEELNSRLGWTDLVTSAGNYGDNQNVPVWVYKEIEEDTNNVLGYWTMSAYTIENLSVFGIYYPTSKVSGNMINSDYYGVRPVINLLKSSI